MKEKILLFAMGVLVGAIISTGIFYFYTKSSSSNNMPNGEMFGGMPNGDFNGERPTGERPSGRPNGNNPYSKNDQTSSN